MKWPFRSSSQENYSDQVLELIISDDYSIETFGSEMDELKRVHGSYETGIKELEVRAQNIAQKKEAIDDIDEGSFKTPALEALRTLIVLSILQVFEPNLMSDKTLEIEYGTAVSSARLALARLSRLGPKVFAPIIEHVYKEIANRSPENHKYIEDAYNYIKQN